MKNTLDKRNKELKFKGQIHSGAELVNGRIQISKSVKLLIIGHYPGEEENAAGEPFIGPAGKNILHLISLVRRDWFKPELHPFDKGDVKICKGLWQSVFDSNVAIFNWKYGEKFEGKNAIKYKAGDCVLVTSVDLEGFRKMLSSNINLSILVLGEEPRKDLIGRKSKAGDIKEDSGTTFFWHHPDPRNARRFWGATKDSKSGFNELLKFLKKIK